ncbi:molybdopterin-dependent oxidoreductase [Thermodesulfobacteriota bacterium]
MKTRRAFLRSALSILTGVVFSSSALFLPVRRLYAKAKRFIIPKGTKRETLVDRNPAELDPTNLEITPLKDFGKMGLSEHIVDISKWKLEIEGHVKNPTKISYEEIKKLPYIKRKVLMICPGYFANYGEWEGISFKELLRISKAESNITHVTVKGPLGVYGQTQRFPMKEIISNQVFLAYKVNGKPLPVKHGFPLRIVAEDYYGFDWVKYVSIVTIDKIEEKSKED